MSSPYLSELDKRARKETWDLVFANRPWTVLFSIAAVSFGIYFQRRYGGQSHTQMTDAFVSVVFSLIGYAVVFLIVFISNFCYFTPKHQNQDLQKLVSVSKSKQDRTKIRNRIAAYWQQLEKQIEELHGLEPLGSVQFDEIDKQRNLELVGEIADYLTENLGFSQAQEFMSNTGFVSKSDKHPIERDRDDHFIRVAGWKNKHFETMELLEWRAIQLKRLLERYQAD